MITFKQYLTEKVYTKQNYLFTNVPIEDVINPSNRYGFGDNYMMVSDEKRLRHYKRYHHGNSSSDPKNNYIYQITGSVDYFDPLDPREVEKLRAMNVDTMISWPFDPKSRMDNYQMERYKFLPVWQGWMSNNRSFIDRYINIEWLRQNLNRVKLIDGNAHRFNKNSRVDEFEMPEWVIGALIDYTEDAKRRLDKQAAEWLKQNFTKPYSRIRVYRGIGTLLGHSGFWDLEDVNDISQIMKPLKRRFGIRQLDDLQKGKPIDLSRGKASSWSTDPQISSSFTLGMASKYINILAVADVPANQVLIDFNLLPLKYQKTFKYLHQNEIIVDTGKIRSIVSWVNLDKKFLEKIQGMGYDYKAGTGIIKKR